MLGMLRVTPSLLRVAGRAQAPPGILRALIPGLGARTFWVGGSVSRAPAALVASAVPAAVVRGRAHLFAVGARFIGVHPAPRQQAPAAAAHEPQAFKEGGAGDVEVVAQEEETRGGERAMGWWLIGCSVLVAGMVHLGGLTRLTGSGLSMDKWKPHGEWPPTTAAEWEAEFEDFKTYPEYLMKRQYENFTVDDFKFIYFMEWSHRMAGRSLGIAFTLPLVYFLARGRVTSQLRTRLLVLFGLGASQGVIGWWMVRSGLTKGKEIDMNNAEEWQYNTQFAAVSPYRLCFHLSTALLIQLLLLRTGLQLLDRGRLLPKSAAAAADLKGLYRFAHSGAGVAFVTAMSGALVAGNHAGLANNDWPFMGGKVIPDGLWEDRLGIRNPFENLVTVQFDHRLLAYTMLGLTLAVANASRKLHLPSRVKMPLRAVYGACVLQALLGVATLWFGVPIEAAASHQLGSVITLSCWMWLLHALRVVSPGARLLPFPLPK